MATSRGRATVATLIGVLAFAPAARSAEEVPCRASAPQPVLFGKLGAGQEVLKVLASPGSALRVYIGEALTSASEIGTGTTLPDGRAERELKLARPLKSGERVVVEETFAACARTKGAAAEALTTRGEAEEVEDPDLDFGRTIATFSAGLVLSREHDDFSRGDKLIGVEVDNTILSPQGIRTCKDGDNACKPGAYARNLLMMTAVDVRLTAIPVTAAGSGLTPAAEPTTGDAMPPAPPAGETSVFQRQAVSTSALVYFPWLAPRWVHGNDQLAFFAAPLFRAGFDSVRREESDTLTDQSQRGALASFGLGTRIGLFKMRGPDAPRLLSYVDVTLGRSDSFEQAPAAGDTAQAPGAPKAAAPAGDTFSPWRWDIRARLTVPRLGLVLGMDGNVSLKDRKNRPSDLRLVLQWRFDIGQMIGKLRG